MKLSSFIKLIFWYDSQRVERETARGQKESNYYRKEERPRSGEKSKAKLRAKGVYLLPRATRRRIRRDCVGNAYPVWTRYRRRRLTAAPPTSFSRVPKYARSPIVLFRLVYTHIYYCLHLSPSSIITPVTFKPWYFKRLLLRRCTDEQPSTVRNDHTSHAVLNLVRHRHSISAMWARATPRLVLSRVCRRQSS